LPRRSLDKTKLRVLKLQAELVKAQKFFLAGGTALEIRLGHRQSMDLDWFTARAFNANGLKTALQALPEEPTHVEQQSPQTLRAYYGDLETSFIAYRQVPPKVETITVAGVQIPVAKLELIAVMKAAAVHDRGRKRDFIDIYALVRQPGWSVPRFIELAARSLPIQESQVARALLYFADAERDPMPPGCAFKWDKVKEEISRGVREWEMEQELSR
jgi:hypothetical protein